MATVEWGEAAGKWSEAAKWKGGKLPGKEDDVVVPEKGGNLEIDKEARECATFVVNEKYKGTFSGIQELKLAGAGSGLGEAGVLFSPGAESNWTYTGFIKTRCAKTQPHKFFCKGKQLKGRVTHEIIGGWLELGDDFQSTNSVVQTQSTSTFITNGHNMTLASFGGGSGSTGIFKFGATVFKLNSTGLVWNMATGATVEAETSVIEITDTTETLKQFTGGTKPYNKIIVASDNVEVVFNGFTVKVLELNTRGKSVKGTIVGKGLIITVTEAFTTNATGAEKVKLKSSEAGKEWKISKTTGTVEVEGIELQDSHAGGGATFKDINGTNVSGNEGWTFEETGGGEHAERSCGDTVEVSSSTATANGTFARSCGDTVTVADAATRVAALARTAADTVSVSDGAAATTAKARTAGDTVAVADTASRSAQTLARTAGDTVAVSDACTGLRTNLRPCGDTVPVSDQVARAAQTQTRTAGDTVTVTDLATRTTSLHRTTADTVTVTDTATAKPGITRTCGDTVAVSDQATRSHTASRTAGDTVTVTDQANRTSLLLRQAGDTVTATSTATGETTHPAAVIYGYLTFKQRTDGTITATHHVDGTITGEHHVAGTLTGRNT